MLGLSTHGDTGCVVLDRPFLKVTFCLFWLVCFQNDIIHPTFFAE